MPDDPKTSPAVQSMENEQALQRDRAADSDLDKGLEDSFPASDPVSMIRTTIPSGRTDPEEAERTKVKPDLDPPASPARADARTVFEDLKTIIKERPLAAVGVVAAVGFLWGLTR
ncbi:hypothetical protein EV561_1519 [Rhizobium sp. BK376]|nr:hypothetical protein EV561_1519 [Rhizobium sp. BK376]